MPTYRARVTADLVYEAKKPLNATELAKIAQRDDTYVHVASTEGIDEIEVRFEHDARHYGAHHHDGINGCRRCRANVQDGLA